MAVLLFLRFIYFSSTLVLGNKASYITVHTNSRSITSQTTTETNCSKI